MAQGTQHIAQMEKVRDTQRDKIKSFGQNTFEIFNTHTHTGKIVAKMHYILM